MSSLQRCCPELPRFDYAGTGGVDDLINGDRKKTN